VSLKKTGSRSVSTQNVCQFGQYVVTRHTNCSKGKG